MEYKIWPRYKIGEEVYAIVQRPMSNQPEVKLGTVRSINWHVDDSGGEGVIGYYLDGDISEANYAGDRLYNELELFDLKEALARHKKLVDKLKPFNDYFHNHMINEAKALLAKEKK